MSQQNNSRASELGETLTSGATGFTVRKRTGVGLFFHLFMLACMVMLGASLLVYYHSPVGCVLTVVLGGSFAFIARNLEQNKKIKEALEFMNALFSSALGKGFKGCFIVKATGDIVFYNRSFQTLFPDYISQGDRTLTALSELYNIPQTDRDQLATLMLANMEGSVTTSIRALEATDAAPLILEVEPIERPTGFLLIRCK